ncbi:alpha/beta fold hydrolase [Kribbella sp. NPDC056951]|uniref:alpha/beta fold hydrolase n=1 Tax=Kribbella sp. NPDC056951 TaxID=3345978 RepID=UPI0036283971
MSTLRTTTWGEGDRVAVLLHGMMGSAHQFWRLGPALADRGYQAIAVDLPGHGNSPALHGDLTTWAAALTESVPPAPALALGHSLGGAVLAASHLRPAQAVYVDIPLTTTAAEPTTNLTAATASRTAVDLTAKFTAARAGRTIDVLRRTKPTWSDTDREVEAAAAKQFDIPTAVALELADNHLQTPATDTPSLVVHADPSRYVSATRAEELHSLGLQVRAIPGADHCIWYSHFDEFLSALDSFVANDRPPYRVCMDVELLVAASAEFERVVGELPEGVWGLPTPCEVDVRELVEHVVEGNRFAAAVLTGMSGREALATARAQDLDLHQSATRQIEAFRTASADQVVHHPGGDISAEAFLRYRLVDVVVHAWDLLRAASLDETLDTTVTDQLWALVEPRLTEMLAFGSYGDGPSGKVASDAPAQRQLLDAFGRR